MFLGGFWAININNDIKSTPKKISHKKKTNHTFEKEECHPAQLIEQYTL